MPTKKELAYVAKAQELIEKCDALANDLEVARREVTELKRDHVRYEHILKNPFSLLKEIVPELDIDADGVFNATELTKEEQIAHYAEIHLVYHSLAFNREITAMVQGLNTFAVTSPETTPEAFKVSRQCIIFVKGMVERFGQLAAKHDDSVAKKKKTIDRTTPIS